MGVVVVIRVARAEDAAEAENTPPNYTRDGITVPGTIGSDKLLKAWIGDRGQDKLSFSWTPTTTSISIRAICTVGDGMKSVRIRIGDWRLTEAGCVGDEGWQLSKFELSPDASFWLDHPVGKPVEVSAEVIDVETRKAGAQDARIAIGIFSTKVADHDSDSGLPSRPVQSSPGDYTANGVTYRATQAGDKLAGASVAGPGETQTRFSFTATGARLVVHTFCTANRGAADSIPYQVSVQLGAGTPYLSSCDGSSTDGALRGTLTVPSPGPAGQRIDVVARIVPARNGVPPVPGGSRLGVGIYFQGAQRVVDGVSLPEQIEVAGYIYRLAEVKTAAGPTGRLSIDTPANQPYMIAAGASTLGAGRLDVRLVVGKSETGLGVDPRTGALGIGWDGHGAGPAGRATMTIAEGKPTKGTLILALYLQG